MHYVSRMRNFSVLRHVVDIVTTDFKGLITVHICFYST
jgi:hypothetical protein